MLGQQSQVLLDGGFAGDVDDLRDEQLDVTTVVTDAADREQTGQHCAVCVDVALVQMVGVHDAGHDLVGVVEVGTEIVRVGHIVDGHPHEDLGGVAEELAQSGVRGQDPAVGRDQGHPDCRIGHRSCEDVAPADRRFRPHNHLHGLDVLIGRGGRFH